MREIFVDLNSYFNETAKDYGYQRLWRSVVIQALKDATESQQAAYDMYIWSKTEAAETVFNFAELPPSLIINLLENISQSETKRYNTINQLMYFKSKVKAPFKSNSSVQTALSF